MTHPKVRCKTEAERRARKRAANLRWLAKNPHKRKEYKRRFMAKNPGYLGPTRQALVLKIDRIKESTPCADCGGYFQACQMDFDHLGDKTCNVGYLASRTRPWREVQKEINKCELVCSNCHRLRTRDRK